MGWFARRSVFRKRWHPRPRPRPLAPLTEAQDLTTLATPREFGVRFTIIDGLVQEVQKDTIVIDDLPTDQLVTSVNGQYGDVTVEATVGATGVTAGTYDIASVTVQADGRITAATANATGIAPATYGPFVNLAINAKGLVTTATNYNLVSSDITNALGFALAHGTYTPTLTNVANLAASTAYLCQYLRVGNSVTVSGRVDVDPTALATATELGMSLPVASNFGAAEDCGGAGSSSVVAGLGIAVSADAANNRASFQWVSGDVSNKAVYFSFTYRVI